MTQRTLTPAISSTAASRRGVLGALAWTAPVVTVAAAAPAYAVSTPAAPIRQYALASAAVTSGRVPEVERCSSLPGGSITFAASIDGIAAPVGTKITVSLPIGLQFVGGGRDTVVTLTQPGIVQVPAFTATGAAGTYSVTAAWNGASASQSVNVVPAPGSVVELRRSTGSASSTASFSTVAVGVTTAVAGSIQGDQTANSTGANGAVLTSDGRVRVWGASTGATAGSPLTLSPTGMSFVDSWTSIGQVGTTAGNAAGGVAAGTTAGSVHQWYATGNVTPRVLAVSGITGTVRAVAAEDGFSYALTTDGVFRWANATGTTAPAASKISGTTISGTGSRISTWSHRGPDTTTLRSGGAAVSGSSVVMWTNPSTGSTLSTSTVTLPTGVGTVVDLVATDSGVMVLGSNGTLWSYGAGFGQTAGTASSSWTVRASGVASFSMWGYNSYVGGLWITTTGAVQQFFGYKNWYTPVAVRTSNITSGATLSGITQTYSSDGTYLALKSDGTVYAWGGNLDNSGRGAATVVNTGAGTTVDLNVWGKHLGDVYYGGGYVIKGAPAC